MWCGSCNQVDRIHAHLLHLCRRRYGPAFWPDFFREIRNAEDRIAEARRLPEGDERRNALYAITLDCFDRLDRLDFKALLQASGVSLTVDVQSLHPAEPGWDRRLLARTHR
ncbi:MAG: hypothetical protein GX591_05385 [Planctomycetes bacterium]|nr:hypothetical protein [Planctomycetota bacterium]